MVGKTPFGGHLFREPFFYCLGEGVCIYIHTPVIHAADRQTQQTTAVVMPTVKHTTS